MVLKNEAAPATDSVTKLAVPREPIPAATVLPEPALLRRQRQALSDLFECIATRARLEPTIDADFQARSASEQEEFDASYQEIIARFALEKETVEGQLAAARKRITSEYKSGRAAAEQTILRSRREITSRYDKEREAAKAEFKEARWTLTAVYEGRKNGLEARLRESQHLLVDASSRLQSLRAEASAWLQECKLGSLDGVEAEPEIPGEPRTEPIDLLHDLLAFAEWKLTELRRLTLPQWFKGEKLLLVFVGLWLLSLYPAGFLAGWIAGLIGSTLAFALVSVVVGLWMYAAAKRQASRISGPLFGALARAESLFSKCREQAETDYQAQLQQNERRYRREVRQASERYRGLRTVAKVRRDRELQDAIQLYRQTRQSLRENREREWTEATTTYRVVRKKIQVAYEEDSRAIQQHFDQAKAQLQKRHEQRWSQLTTLWTDGVAQFRTAIADIQAECRQWFSDWYSPAWRNWQPPASIPPVFPFGEYHLHLAHVPHGLSAHPRLKTEEPTYFAVPALTAFPPSLLLLGADEGRSIAVQLLQAAMMRLLTLVPPGTLRFTIIDPVGLGQNFASFMHLADFDEALVTSRIWTEASRIEQRLADLTTHMEDVIQKYLRNQYETIEEYNAQAGEVAEPYRVVVVANFPMNFSAEAARRLVSIVHSGPRCGVYTLISVDTKQPLPQGLDLRDLEGPGVLLAYKEHRYLWQDPDFETFPLDLDAPPPEELTVRLLQQIGEAARAAKRVEVPFEFVAPPQEQWWTGDSRHGIQVPLGRVGATKRQYLKLGQGTAQHVLVAGKTGSGKSTLLHALISNLALLYRPDEVELYLIDFKKGVEFKTYANHALPHARVVAIESEREFGLSVLQRLDAELRTRGERFRRVGAQDLAAYRESAQSAAPRILLIVDEFQEFFVEDDRISQEAALLLDRLVRQGRAFGLHVLLGSQTLGGAYSLARSTIDQMAVRIALQCSEADAALILSEDNTAARLLSRPGEAIYNDANGLVEGNNPFQVVWLDDDRREQYLTRIQELAERQHITPPAPQLVFEGNAPAEVTKNGPLMRLLAEPRWPERPRSAQAWLGEAIAIKDPTSAQFRPQSGHNLLIVGQSDEAALGVLSTAIISLAAQYATRAGEQAHARFYLLDGSRSDEPHAGFLGRLAAIVPQPVREIGWQEVAEVVREIGEEVERRQTQRPTDAATLFFIVYGLQRFRDLRKAEDDYGYGSAADDKPNPAREFAAILREGPAVGVHVLLWCDSLNNLNRMLDRQSLREFEMRVLFQMSVADSSNLIDSPLASKLGLYRALFHSEEQGRLEKFRPYGVPTSGWLAEVKAHLAHKQAPLTVPVS